MAYRDDLEAAVARADAAERALAGVCHVHTATPSTAECAACQRRFCDACTMLTDDGPRCTTCFVAWSARRGRRRTLVAVAGLGAACLGAAAFVTLGGGHDPATDPIARSLDITGPRTEAPRYATRPNRIRVLRETLTADACNRDAALELAELLNENQVYGETLEANRAFHGRCGWFGQLAWTSIHAHEQRGEFAPAAALATELIAGEPTDADFWWWRGQDRAQLREHATAAADYRQSMALGGQRFAAFRFAAVAEAMHEPCEGAFAIRYLVAVDRGGRFGDAWERFKQLFAAGACDALNGHGKATIHFKPEVPLVTAKIKLGTTVASVIVDSSAGFLTLDRKLAPAPAELANAPRVQGYVMGELREGVVAELPEVALDGAAATEVSTLFVDGGLPPGVDGVVGLSFLWRFAVERNDERGEIVLTGW